MFTAQQLIGYILPIGAMCLKCMTPKQKEKAAADTGGHAFFPIRWNISLSDGEITCDCCETVLQKA